MVKASLDNISIVKIQWKDQVFTGGSGGINPSAFNFLEMAILTCISKGLLLWCMSNLTLPEVVPVLEFFGEFAIG